MRNNPHAGYTFIDRATDSSTLGLLCRQHFVDDPGQLPGTLAATALQPHTEDRNEARFGIGTIVSHPRFTLHPMGEEEGLDLLFPEELVAVFQRGVAVLSQVSPVKVPVLADVGDQRLQRVAGAFQTLKEIALTSHRAEQALLDLLFGLFQIGMQSIMVSIGMEYVNAGAPLDMGLSHGFGSIGYAIANAVLGMLIPGSTQVKIFGGIIISIVAAAGGSPFIACGLLPCICGAMHGVTPPYCACIYTGMGIADAELKPTLKNCAIWIGLHYVLSVVVMMGWLPLVGMIG